MGKEWNIYGIRVSWNLQFIAIQHLTSGEIVNKRAFFIYKKIEQTKMWVRDDSKIL